jgi:hypothetical protein
MPSVPLRNVSLFELPGFAHATPTSPTPSLTRTPDDAEREDEEAATDSEDRDEGAGEAPALPPTRQPPQPGASGLSRNSVAATELAGPGEEDLVQVAV